MSTQTALAIWLVVFFGLMVAISLWARKRISTGEDFIVAGRNLPGIMTTATIMATWYASETILVTADWVNTDGFHVIVLEPLGIGLCLILAGLVYARRIWSLKLMTLPDVFKHRFGPVVEKLQALIAVSYISWVAVQLIGLPPLVLLTAALFQRQTRALPGILTLGLGISLWLFEMISNMLDSGTAGKPLTPGFPVVMLVASVLIYVISDWAVKALEGSRQAGATAD